MYTHGTHGTHDVYSHHAGDSRGLHEYFSESPTKEFLVKPKRRVSRLIKYVIHSQFTASISTWSIHRDHFITGLLIATNCMHQNSNKQLNLT